MAAPARIALEHEDGVPVAHVLDLEIRDEQVIREVAEQLLAVVPASGPFDLIVDLSDAEIVPLSFSVWLLRLQKRADLATGSLRLCGLSSTMRTYFKITGMDRIITHARDRREAREAFGVVRESDSI